MRAAVCTIPAASLPAWLAAGWRVRDPEWPVGQRGEGVHARVEWSGVGSVPWVVRSFGERVG